MLQLIFGCVVVAGALLLSDKLSRRGLISKELTRKSTHIILSLAFVLLAFFIGLKWVALLAAFDIAIAVLARRYKWFESSRSVGRKSWGEFFFLIGTILAALLANTKWIFASGILIMGLADAAAALLGTKHGKHAYKVFGHTKSIEGSLAFMIVSAAILGLITFIAPSGFSSGWSVIVWLPLTAAALEALAPLGSDNFILPVFIVLALNLAVVAN